MALDTPDYEVERTIGPVEIRHYASYMVASTRVSGSLQNAGNTGFGILARYIFGGNDAGNGTNEKIEMTSPVLQLRAEDRFEVRFMMPRKYTADSLPTPTDDRVTLERVDSQRMAVLPYRGSWSQSLHDRNLRQLNLTLARADMTPTGDPVWARYDPPWKPWFLRRNEVMLPLD